MPLSQIVSASIEDGAVAPVDLSSIAQYTGFKNRIINGAMVIDQRNNGASVTPFNGQYLVDRWFGYQNNGSKYSAQQTTTAPTGFINSLRATSLSAYSVLATDVYTLGQVIEGLNVADLGWGTANAHTVTLSFRVYSSLTGTFGGNLANSAQNRSYPFTYSIPVANTWTTISVTIPGDTTGTWLTTNGIGMYVFFGLGVGSTYSGIAGAWVGAINYSAAGAVSIVGTSGATFYITGVQLEKGVTATSFDYRPYGTELQLCQRYYYQSTNYGAAMNYAQADFNVYGPLSAASNWLWASQRLQVPMRVAPTVTTSDQVGTTGKLSLWSSAGGTTSNGTTPYTIYTTPNIYLVSVYTESKYGFFGAVKADAEL
jgi:hypothetical protein